MNGTTERRLEIFAPFSDAMDLTKKILFDPFDLTKWLVIGFAAFLSHLAGGGGGFGNYGKPFGKDANWKYYSSTHDLLQSTTPSDWTGCYLLGAVIGVLLVLAIVALCLWVGCRGRFIFLDCVVRNRGAIVEPWHEFRKEGNSLFLFTLAVGLSAAVLVGLLSIPVWLPLALNGGSSSAGPGFFVRLITLGGVVVLLALAFAMVVGFMVPIMYRRRCGAVEGFKASLALVLAEPGPVILFYLFLLVLGIAFAMVSCLLSCVTCCLAALPYVGTVILLPFYVFFLSYLLLFLRQFGPDYDVWANVATVTTATLIPPAATEPPANNPLPPPDVPPTAEPPTPPPVQS